MDFTGTEKKIFLVLGKRGSGKSFFVKHQLKSANRFLVFDTLGEYDGGVIIQDINQLIEYWGKNLNKNFRIVYQPLQPDDEFPAICDLVWACGNMVFVVEEIDRFCDSTHLSGEFANIVQRGRHKDITLVAISQRPYRVNRTLSSQVKELYTFQQSEPRDIDFLSEFIGQDVDRVRELPLYSFLHWQSGGKIVVDKV